MQRMYTFKKNVSGAVLLLVGCLLFSSWSLTGCVPSRPTRYYTLDSHIPDEQPVISATLSGKSAPLRLGIGPLQTADYLERPQMVIRTNTHGMMVDDLHQWISPPSELLYGVLAENLSTLLKTDHILQYPWYPTPAPEVQVRMNLIQMDGNPGKGVQLRARWQLIFNDSPPTIIWRKSNIFIPAPGQGYADFALAHSKAVAALCHEIATAVSTHRRYHP